MLDLTQVVAGPFATMTLADLGAEVVKIERPGTGEDLRTVTPYEGREGHQDYFNSLNRSKKSVVLDLKAGPERAIARELAARAHLLVENFAPGTAERLGLGWEEVRALNPRLVYCSLSGFGQTGPSRDRLALDSVIQAVAGVMSVTGRADGEPTKIGAPICDVVAGLFAAVAVLGALRAAERDGRGQYVDLSMQAAVIAALGPRMAETLQAGLVPARIGNENPIRVPSNVYRAGDGRYLLIQVQSERHWPALCRALGREEWLADPRFAGMTPRVRNRAEVDALVGARIAEEPAAVWIVRLKAERVPFAPVNDYAEALADPQVAHRGLVRTLAHPTSGAIRVVGAPWLTPGMEAPMRPPPLLGGETGAVLGDWLGWEDRRIDRFLKDAAARRREP
ncbi:MAG: CoA transferase [Proteobacteria bacterium]|nr:CoA transferase [Pseudomonadota bacterium]